MIKDIIFDLSVEGTTTYEKTNEATVAAVNKEPKDGVAAESQPTLKLSQIEQKRYVRIPRTARTESLTYKEWSEKARELGCTQLAIDIYWDEAVIAEDGIVTKEDEKTEKETFGDAQATSFTGTRAELQNYLQRYFPDLYNSLFYKTVNMKTRDWFDAMSAEAVQSALKMRQFDWNIEYRHITIKDEKEPVEMKYDRIKLDNAEAAENITPSFSY